MVGRVSISRCTRAAYVPAAERLDERGHHGGRRGGKGARCFLGGVVNVGLGTHDQPMHPSIQPTDRPVTHAPFPSAGGRGLRPSADPSSSAVTCIIIEVEGVPVALVPLPLPPREESRLPLYMCMDRSGPGFQAGSTIHTTMAKSARRHRHALVEEGLDVLQHRLRVPRRARQQVAFLGLGGRRAYRHTYEYTLDGPHHHHVKRTPPPYRTSNPTHRRRPP